MSDTVYEGHVIGEDGSRGVVVVGAATPEKAEEGVREQLSDVLMRRCFEEEHGRVVAIEVRKNEPVKRIDL